MGDHRACGVEDHRVAHRTRGAAEHVARLRGIELGLATDQLDEHVDLAVVNDYRQIMTEVLTAADGRAPAASVFPGFTPRAPLGLFRG